MFGKVLREGGIKKIKTADENGKMEREEAEQSNGRLGSGFLSLGESDRD